ncbi:MAG: ABC transporter ATP-binding protein [Pseudomonadota bacterium]
MLELLGLTKLYDGTPAIQDVSLTVRDDEYLTLLGPSGSGKTTLLRLIAGLERPDAGRVRMNGTDVTALPAHRRSLGFVQQNYALFPHMSVADNVAFGLRYREVDPVSDAAEVARRVASMLQLVGLTGLDERMTGQISGGQKQRVSLARTLVTEPRFCLLDEPIGALDANLRERMTVELRRIREALGVTFIHVTGNEAEALAMGDRMVVLDEGSVIMIDEPDVVFGRPDTVRVAKFLNAYNVFSGSAHGDKFGIGAHDLPLPPGAQGAAYYAVRFDTASIARGHGTAPAGHAALPAKFITSEFMGAKVIYFLEKDTGGVVEVERHLSRADPVDYTKDEPVTVHWDLADVTVFDTDGRRIYSPDALAGAA